MTFILLDEVSVALLRGIVILAVGGSLYLLQKRSEKRENRRELAKILRNEIFRTLDKLSSVERDPTINKRSRILYLKPDSRVYEGLLNTGNIQFFSKNLQANLNVWYGGPGSLRFERYMAVRGGVS